MIQNVFYTIIAVCIIFAVLLFLQILGPFLPVLKDWVMTKQDIREMKQSIKDDLKVMIQTVKEDTKREIQTLRTAVRTEIPKQKFTNQKNV